MLKKIPNGGNLFITTLPITSILITSEQVKVNVQELNHIATVATKEEMSVTINFKKTMLYGRFIKTSTLKTVETVETDYDESFSSKCEESIPFVLNDEQLLEACGGKSIHTGANLGLSCSGKLSRIEKQDQELLEKSKTSENWVKVENCKTKNKRRHKETMGRCGDEINKKKIVNPKESAVPSEAIEIVDLEDGVNIDKPMSKKSRLKSKRRIENLTHQLSSSLDLSESSNTDERKKKRKIMKNIREVPDAAINVDNDRVKTKKTLNTNLEKDSSTFQRKDIGYDTELISQKLDNAHGQIENLTHESFSFYDFSQPSTVNKRKKKHKLAKNHTKVLENETNVENDLFNKQSPESSKNFEKHYFALQNKDVTKPVLKESKIITKRHIENVTHELSSSYDLSRPSFVKEEKKKHKLTKSIAKVPEDDTNVKNNRLEKKKKLNINVEKDFSIIPKEKKQEVSDKNVENSIKKRLKKNQAKSQIQNSTKNIVDGTIEDLPHESNFTKPKNLNIVISSNELISKTCTMYILNKLRKELTVAQLNHKIEKKKRSKLAQKEKKKMDKLSQKLTSSLDLKSSESMSTRKKKI